ncbi:MAG TPA: ABC transporter ATP-binding protein [Gemmatimonadales bacterium]|nr:ABC transporter ATP-binding protein [Gemmatimonadales bacterium]
MSPPEPAAAPPPAAHRHGDELLRLEDVTRLYPMGGGPVKALDGVSLVIRRGEFVAVMGPSGSGKSTLLNVLGCLDTPSSGRYLLEGREVQGLSEAQLADVRRKSVGFIFQSYHLVPRMTAARNVELPLVLAGMAPAARRTRVSEVLAAVGLVARATHRPDQLSGGERQRVAIARAMAARPALLLADEPTGNLDTRTADGIMALLEQLHAGGLTIVMVTHDPRMGARAERKLAMVDGKLASDVVLTHVQATG